MVLHQLKAAVSSLYRIWRRRRAAKLTTDTLSFIHCFEASAAVDARPLLLLHGTSGDESSLLWLGRKIAPRAPLLSPRGKVLENGASRFFRRIAPNVLDEEDVRRRANELADFVTAACVRYRIPIPIAVGYSNGANMATTLLLLRPETLAGAILLRAAQITLSDVAPPDLTDKPVLMLSGADDPTILPERFSKLVAFLRRCGASVEARVVPGGHELSRADARISRKWLEAYD